MEDEKKISATSEDAVENVQQEAESQENQNQEPQPNESPKTHSDEVSSDQQTEADTEATPASDDEAVQLQESAKPEEGHEEKVTVEAVETTIQEENTAPADTATAEEKQTEQEDPPKETSDTDNQETRAETNDDEHHDHHEEDEHEENEYDHVELDNASKKELLEWLKKIKQETEFKKVDRIYKDIGSHYDALYNEERQAALEAFLKIEGNDESDFEYKGDDTDKQFYELHEELRLKRSHYFHQLEKQKEENLARKQEILDLIRESVDGEDQTSFNKVKKLQEEWKKIGPVPGPQNRTLWANYQALMDRFYDQRSIYFELKDLDRKKNLKAKIELCEKAEALDPENDLKGAIVQLNELHDEYKHIGPVPKEDQEPLWQRFKAASDRVYEFRKEFTRNLKETQQQNLEKKRQLAAKVEEFVSFDSDRIKEWNQQTKKIQALQKEWEAIGGVPRDKAKEVNRAFWGNFKKFFANKSQFFKRLDEQRQGNLEKKQALVARAAELKDSEAWEETAKELKQLQQQWKEIGPVPEKFRNSVYQEFKGHCDHFFDRRREQNAGQNQEFVENLKKKQAILDEMEKLAETEPLNLDKAYDLASDFSEIGLVPKNAVAKTLDRYDAISQKWLSTEMSEADRQDLKMHLEVSKLRNSPHGDKKISRKENTLRRKISGLENDIANWKNNMDFLANSKSADAFRKEFQQKIDEAEEHLKDLKQQLRLLK